MTDTKTSASSEPKGPLTSICCQAARGEADLQVGRILWNKEHSVWAILANARSEGEEVGPIRFCPFCGSKLSTSPMNAAIARERFIIADGLDTVALLEVHGEIIRSLISEGDTIAEMLEGADMPDIESKMLVWEGIPVLEGDSDDQGIFFNPTGWRAPTLSELARFHKGISPILQEESAPVEVEANGKTPDQAAERIILSGRRLVPPRRWDRPPVPGTVGRVAMALFKVGGTVSDSVVAQSCMVDLKRVEQIRTEQIDDVNKALHSAGVDAVDQGGQWHLFEHAP